MWSHLSYPMFSRSHHPSPTRGRSSRRSLSSNPWRNLSPNLLRSSPRPCRIPFRSRNPSYRSLFPRHHPPPRRRPWSPPSWMRSPNRNLSPRGPRPNHRSRIPLQMNRSYPCPSPERNPLSRMSPSVSRWRRRSLKPPIQTRTSCPRNLSTMRFPERHPRNLSFWRHHPSPTRDPL